MKPWSLLLILLSVWSCSPRASSSSEAVSGRVTIGFAMDSLVVERWVRDRDAFMNRAQQLGADVILQVANEDSENQSRQIAWLVSQKVNVIVVVPNDSLRIAPAIRYARGRGIPVVAYDRMAENAGVDLFVSFDNLEIGKMIAQTILDRLPKGRIMIINGSRRDNNAHLYNQGIHEVLAPRLASGAYRIFSEAWLENWSNEEATRAVEDALGNEKVGETDHPDAILCANDFLAEAAIQVLAEHRIAGKVLVVGHDAELAACQRIVEGTQLATIYKPIPQLAALCAEMAIRLAKHQGLPPHKTLSDGTSDVPFLSMDAHTVVKETMMETVIKDGFHRMEDVYRNIPVEKRPKS